MILETYSPRDEPHNLFVQFTHCRQHHFTISLPRHPPHGASRLPYTNRFLLRYLAICSLLHPLTELLLIFILHLRVSISKQKRWLLHSVGTSRQLYRTLSLATEGFSVKVEKVCEKVLRKTVLADQCTDSELAQQRNVSVSASMPQLHARMNSSCCRSFSDLARQGRFWFTPIWRAKRRHASRGFPEARVSASIPSRMRMGPPCVRLLAISVRTISLACCDQVRVRRGRLLFG